jgi:tetratricopeptide (TPR) repeat protein
MSTYSSDYKWPLQHSIPSTSSHGTLAREGIFPRQLLSKDRFSNTSNPFLSRIEGGMIFKDLQKQITIEVSDFYGLRKVQVRNQDIPKSNVYFFDSVRGENQVELLTGNVFSNCLRNLSKGMGELKLFGSNRSRRLVFYPDFTQIHKSQHTVGDHGSSEFLSFQKNLKKRRKSIESRYVEKLKMVCAGEGEEIFQQRLVCMQGLGDCYAAKRTKESIIHAAGLYNYALHCAKKINDKKSEEGLFKKLAHLEEDLILVLLGDLPRENRALYCQISQDFKKNLTFINQNRENRKHLTEIREEIDVRIAKLGEEPSTRQVREIHSFITERMKEFTAHLIEQGVRLIGIPTCKYAVIGLGSMAREEMTHYSDLEFAILIEEDSITHKTYFRNLSYLLQLKIINLGETILPALNIPFLKEAKFFDDLIPRGFAFDGAGVQGKGCKTPFGNTGNVDEKGKAFELIQTPGKMAQYIGIDSEGTDWPDREPHLPFEMLNFILITGDNSLKDDYQAAIDKELSVLFRDGMILRQYLAKKLLRCDDERYFDPCLNLLAKEGQFFKIKQDLYRLPHLMIDRLTLLGSGKKINTLDRIEELGLFNQNAIERIQWIVKKVMYMRLTVYSFYKAQKELMSPLLKPFRWEDSELVQREFTADQSTQACLTKIYQILLPFYEAAKRFIDGMDESIRQSDCWDDSDLTGGHIATRMLQFNQAKNHYKLALDKAPQDIQALSSLGGVLLQLGEAEEAKKHFTHSLSIIRSKSGEKDSKIVMILYKIGECFEVLGDFSKAFNYYKEALQINKEIFGENDIHNILIYSRIGTSLQYMDKAQEALALYLDAIAICSKFDKEEAFNPCLADVLCRMGGMLWRLGNFKKASECQNEAISIFKKLYGSRHPNTAILFNNIGVLFENIGRYNDALSYYNKALAIYMAYYGEQHPHTAQTLDNLGKIYDSLGDSQKSLYFHNRALSIYKVFYENGNPDIARVLDNIGTAHDKLGQFTYALKFRKAALSIYESSAKESHNTALSLNNVGITLDNLGEMDEALKYYETAYNIMNKIVDKHAGPISDLAMIINNIGCTYMQLGDYPKALYSFKQALPLNIEFSGERHPDVAMNLSNIGEALGQMNLWEESLNRYNEALDIQKEFRGSDPHPDIAEIFKGLGDVYRNLVHYNQSIKCYNKAIAMYKKLKLENHPDSASVFVGKGHLEYELHKKEEGTKCYLEALLIYETYEQEFEKKHPGHIKLLKYLDAHQSIKKRVLELKRTTRTR